MNDQYPKLFVEDQPEAQKRSKLAIGLIVLVLLAMPVGVYLSLRTQNPNSQAAVEEVKNPEDSLRLVSRTSSVNNQAVFPVDVIVRSDTQAVNLISTKLFYPTDLLEVVSIAPSNPDLTDESRVYVVDQWIERSFDQTVGSVQLTGTVSGGGVQTKATESQQSVLATIYFKAKTGGVDADILFDQGGLLLTTTGQKNILATSQSLKLPINDAIGDFTEQRFRVQAEQFKNTPASASASLRIDTPNGGEVLPFANQVQIKWSDTATASAAPPKRNQLAQIKTISIALLQNEEFLGYIANDIQDSGSFIWNPATTLPPVFIKPENTYRIEIERRDASNQKETILADGPFSLTLQPSSSARIVPEEELTVERVDLNADGVVDLKDVSLMVSQFNAVTEANVKADINNDRVINGIDLWYLRKRVGV